MDCLTWLRNILWMCGKYENINYMIMTKDLVNNSILSLHLGIWLWLKGRGIVSSVRIVSHSCVTMTKSRL